MKILYVAPLPPPRTGHSLVSEFIRKTLERHHIITLLNLSKKSLKNGFNSLYRLQYILTLFILMPILSRKNDKIYYTLSQSVSGFSKDLIVFLICSRYLNKFIIHSHGLGLTQVVLRRNIILRSFARLLFMKVSKLIVLSSSHKISYSGLISLDKVEIIENFFSSELLIDLDAVREKFANLDSINILFLSNLIEGKGHLELLQAFKVAQQLTDVDLRIKFAGAFASTSDEQAFIRDILNVENAEYVGIISGDIRADILKSAHIFCLPTYYKYEGQPLSVIEAYAAGCFVITTPHAGIPDIFIDGKNGRFVQPRSYESLYATILDVISDHNRLLELAIWNRNVALTRFSEELYRTKINRLFS